MDINNLQFFLNQNAFPKVKRQPKTFLGIAKQPHYENVLSNIYAFYFKVSEEHGMQDLFITSLLELIDESKFETYKKVNDISDFEVQTEVSTNKNGRIDLLLSNTEHAIIIENKVYHKLNNDLDDYWISTKVADNLEENKIGILLSLFQLNATHFHKHFINITHLEFLKRVTQNLGNYILEANDKYIVFLKDFYQNILNMSKSEMNSKELKFYFDNQAKIIEVKNFHFAVREHIYNQVEAVINLVEDDLILVKSKGKPNKRLRFLLSPRNKNLMVTVVFEDLLIPKKELFLIVELKNDLLLNRERYASLILTDQEKAILKSDFYKNKNSSWCHFAVKNYFLSEENVAHLGQFIAEKLEEDGLLSIYRKLEKFI